jgi:glycosyltransferase involved in cell wall biosynthesis
VYLEALACRMPIVGLRANAFPELSQGGKVGFILDDETPDALAETLLSAFQSPEILETKGQAGQSFCLERFTWKQTVARMLDVMLEGRTAK